MPHPRDSGERPPLPSTLLAGRGSLLTPVAAPIAFSPSRATVDPTPGRVTADDANYAVYRAHPRKMIEEPFALFMQ